MALLKNQGTDIDLLSRGTSTCGIWQAVPEDPSIQKANEGEKARLAKHALCKHGGLSSSPRTRVKNPDTVVYTCDPSAGEAGKGGFQELDDLPPSLTWPVVGP